MLQHSISSRLAYYLTQLPEDGDFRPCMHGVFPLQCSLCFLHIITVPTGLMVPWPFALMYCWELLLTPRVTQTADFGT